LSGPSRPSEAVPRRACRVRVGANRNVVLRRHDRRLHASGKPAFGRQRSRRALQNAWQSTLKACLAASADGLAASADSAPNVSSLTGSCGKGCERQSRPHATSDGTLRLAPIISHESIYHRTAQKVVEDSLLYVTRAVSALPQSDVDQKSVYRFQLWGRQSVVSAEFRLNHLVDLH
jgi:hypothetical protein